MGTSTSCSRDVGWTRRYRQVRRAGAGTVERAGCTEASPTTDVGLLGTARREQGNERCPAALPAPRAATTSPIARHKEAPRQALVVLDRPGTCSHSDHH